MEDRFSMRMQASDPSPGGRFGARRSAPQAIGGPIRTVLLLLLAAAVAGLDSGAAHTAPAKPWPAESAAVESTDPVQRELALRRRVMETPELPEAYLDLADHLEGRGAGDEALAMLVSSAERWLRSGEPRKAIVVLTRAVELAPEDPRVALLLGRAYTQDRDFEAAEPPLRRALELGSRDPAALVFLGSVLWEIGEIEEAEPFYRQAVEATGRAFLPLSQLGRLLLWQGRYDEAVEVLQEATARDPRAVIAQFDLAEALRGLGRLDEAAAAYRRVTALAPDLMKAHYGLAAVLARQGDREGSQREFEVYQRLIEANEVRTRTSEIQEGEIQRGLLLLEEGKVAEAVARLEGLVESVEVLLAKARAYSVAGDEAAALRSLERVMVLDPSRQDVRRRLAEKRMELAGESRE